MSDSGSECQVLTKSILGVADQLRLESVDLAIILGLAPAQIEQMRKGSRQLDPEREEWGAALLLVRAFQALLAIVGDVETARAWIASQNRELGLKPAAMMATRDGLVRVVSYLEASRP